MSPADPFAPVAVPEALRRRLLAIPATTSVLVASDFDGTISDLVDRPDDATIYPGMASLLTQLATAPGTAVAVVSGRALADLAARSGLAAPVVLIGSHGAEWPGRPPRLDPAAAGAYDRLDAAVTEMAAGVPGALVERKPVSIAVHVRRAAPDAGDRLLAAVAAGPAQWPGVHATAGKMVLELAVQHVDKGRALRDLRAQRSCDLVVFVGDDVTDERAFAALDSGDVTIKVGAGDTAAAYRVESVAAVRAVLALLAAAR